MRFCSEIIGKGLARISGACGCDSHPFRNKRGMGGAPGFVVVRKDGWAAAGRDNDDAWMTERLDFELWVLHGFTITSIFGVK